MEGQKWKINPEEFAKAIEFLGLEYPVVVVPTTAKYVGKYHGIGFYGPGAGPQGYNEPTHVVTLSHDLGASMASRCAWHELTHAQQAESFMPEHDEGDIPRWKIGLRDFTSSYADEADRTGGYSSASGAAATLPSYSYTKISYEEECNDNMKNATDIPICDYADGVEENLPERRKWRVDHVPFQGDARTWYILACFKSDAIAYVKKQDGVESYHNVYAYPCPIEEEAEPQAA